MIKLLPILNEIGGVTGPIRYDMDIEGRGWSVKFDVNKNPTKLGVKMQFFPKDGSDLDPQEINNIGNDIASFLQKKFATTDIIIDRDKDMPDKYSGVGFIIPLDSLSRWVVEEVLGNKKQQDDEIEDAGSETTD